MSTCSTCSTRLTSPYQVTERTRVDFRLSYRFYLLLWQSLVGCSNLLLPSEPVLAENLSADWEALATLEQDGANNDGVWPHDLLIMVDVTSAVSAEVAVDTLA